MNHRNWRSISLEFHDETKGEVNPIKLHNFLSDKCNQKVNELTTDSNSGFSFEIKKNEELNLLSERKSLKTSHGKLLTANSMKNLTKKNLEEEYPFIENAIEASRIKIRNSNKQGEKAKTKVYESYERPMSCKKCLKYGHTVNRCRETIETCAKLSNQGHKKRRRKEQNVRTYTCSSRTIEHNFCSER